MHRGAAVWVAAGVLACLLWAPAVAGKDLRPPPPPAPPGFRTVHVPAGATTVQDGDTFEADLNRDGRITPPQERVRLLYVDTPELGTSHKGQDRAHGLPARAFLARHVVGQRLRLHVPLDRPTGNYGRTLAVVWAAGRNLNRALIGAGHSPFDTRFRFPYNYRAYAEAEAGAFDAGRGIWADAASRGRYLKRLRREARTPVAQRNARYVPAVLDAAVLDPTAVLGLYVQLTARVERVQQLRKGVRRITVTGRAPQGFTVVAFARVAERLGVDAWGPGSTVWVEGFVQTYRGDPQLVLHWGAPHRPARPAP